MVAVTTSFGVCWTSTTTVGPCLIFLLSFNFFFSQCDYMYCGPYQHCTPQLWCTNVFNRSLNHLSVYFSTVSPFRIYSSSAGHGKKTGTNLYAALRRVNEMIGYLKQNSAENHFNETQNIIIIETDGDHTRNVSQTRAGEAFPPQKESSHLSSFNI